MFYLELACLNTGLATDTDFTTNKLLDRFSFPLESNTYTSKLAYFRYCQSNGEIIPKLSPNQKSNQNH